MTVSRHKSRVPARTKKRLYAKVKSPYPQPSVKKRIEAFFLGNIGRIATREQIIEVARNPKTGRQRENWHRARPLYKVLRRAWLPSAEVAA